MRLTRYIIWTSNFNSTNEVMDLLTPHSTIVVSISDTILCIESEITVSRIRQVVGDDMEIACLEMDEKFINRLLKKKFKANEKKNFNRFLNMTKVPSSIDEALDLINERGGVEFLNDREIQALDRLTNKPS